MDAVTGLSGSGPRIYFIGGSDGDAGLPKASRERKLRGLAARTCLGAAKMLEDTNLPPEELRRRVTSPNGTTQRH